MPRASKVGLMAALAALAALIAIAACAGAFDSEPKYQGVRLSKWVKAFNTSDEGTSQHEHAGAALRAMGTNALAVLFRRMQYPGWTLSRYVRKLPRVARRPAVNLLRGPSQERYHEAEEAKSALAAWSNEPGLVLPELKRLIFSTNTLIATRAASALSFMGTNAIPVYLAALSAPAFSGPGSSPMILFLALFDIGTNTQPLVPFFMTCLTNSTPGTRSQAAEALAEFHDEPENFIPALSNLLSHPDPEIRITAITAVSQFDATTSVPILETLREDTDPAVRKAVTNAISRISAGAGVGAPTR